MLCNFLDCIIIVFLEMSFVKNALLTMEYGVFIISESGDIKIRNHFKLFNAPTK